MTIQMAWYGKKLTNTWFKFLAKPHLSIEWASGASILMIVMKKLYTKCIWTVIAHVQLKRTKKGFN